MANILLEELPAKVQTESGTFEPITDFRASIAFEIMVENGVEDLGQLMTAYYPDGMPKHKEIEAISAALWLYRCGEENKKDENKPGKKGKRCYSFALDAETIYSDFSRYYNIDLTTEHMHWWKFKALLMGLPTDSAFKERIYYRVCDLKGLPKKEQQRIKKIRAEIEIKEHNASAKQTLEERNAAMLAYVDKRLKETRG